MEVHMELLLVVICLSPQALPMEILMLQFQLVEVSNNLQWIIHGSTNQELSFSEVIRLDNTQFTVTTITCIPLNLAMWKQEALLIQWP